MHCSVFDYLAAAAPVATSATALIVAYGAARAGTVLCNEARNMVFAKVRLSALPAGNLSTCS